MKCQTEEPCQGCDAIANAMGKNVKIRAQQFRKWFCVQNPYLPTPPRESHPNWKIDPVLKHINKVSMEAVDLPQNVSVDEQTIGFQGRSVNKSRIKYKKVGDGFQADSLCCEGYTYSFYFRHQRAPENYTRKGVSSLHSRVLFLFDQLKCKHHCCFMDNLYMSALFAKQSLLSKNQVMIHGVTKNHQKGVPKIIQQNEVQNETLMLQQKGTVKVAVLNGDPDIKPMIAISYYDSKPIYFLSTVVRNVEWIELARRCFNKEKFLMDEVKFLRPNFVHAYNNDMNHADIADQLGLVYKTALNLHIFKWWQAILFWSIDKAHTAAYKLRNAFHLAHNSKAMLHYTFLETHCLDSLKEDTSQPRKTRKVNSKNKVSSTSSVSSLGSRSRRSSRNAEHSECTDTLDDSHYKQGFGVGRILLKSRSIKWTGAVVDSKEFNERRLTFSTATCHLPAHHRNKYSECQLHKWCLKDSKDEEICRYARHKKGLMKCPDCQVILCLDCYTQFHTVANLHTLKNRVNDEDSEGARMFLGEFLEESTDTQN